MEEIEQGNSRTTSGYSIEFEMLALQLGTAGTLDFKRRHYLRGLPRTVRNVAISTLKVDEPFKDLVKRCCEIARNVEFGKSLERKTPAPSQSSSRPGVASPSSYYTKSPVTSVNTTRDADGKFVRKLTEAEKEYLRKNGGCFNCRKVRIGHIAPDCPEKELEVQKARWKEAKKETKSVSALVIDESETDSDYSRPKSVPTIKL
jgi:hypothetical protein